MFALYILGIYLQYYTQACAIAIQIATYCMHKCCVRTTSTEGLGTKTQISQESQCGWWMLTEN